MDEERSTLPDGLDDLSGLELVQGLAQVGLNSLIFRMAESGQNIPDIPLPQACSICAARRAGTSCFYCIAAESVYIAWLFMERPSPDGSSLEEVLASAPWDTPVVFVHGNSKQVGATTLHHPPEELSSEDYNRVIKELEITLFKWAQIETTWVSDKYPLQSALFARYSVVDLAPENVMVSKIETLAHIAFHGITEEDSPEEIERLKRPDTITPRHPAVMLNVFMLTGPYALPQSVADAVAHIAQEYIGWFHGRSVRSGQMELLRTDTFGSIYDPSVTTGAPWTEPLAYPDDCDFCQEMTDENIRLRIDGFQWAMDKELAHTVGWNKAHGYPDPLTCEPGDWEKRAEFRRQQVSWERAHPEGLHAYYLHDLPYSLKRSMVIRWNHVWRDWLSSDPRYSMRHGRLYLLYNKKLVDALPSVNYHPPYYYRPPDSDADSPSHSLPLFADDALAAIEQELGLSAFPEYDSR